MEANEPIQQGLPLGGPPLTPDAAQHPLAILPSWDDASSMILPNCLVRSGLFSISKASGNLLLKRKKIPSAVGIDIVYTGPVLVQSDFDVWYGLLSLAKAQHNRDVVEFGTKPLLTMLGRSTGKTDREWLKGSIAKLSATTIEVTFGDVTYGGSLVDEFVRDETSSRYAVRLNGKLARLFGPSAWSLIDFDQRAKLRYRPLAQWLHAFYSTHRTPLDYGVAKLMDICGSTSKEIAGFRQKLREALDAVAEVTGWDCKIRDDIDTVSVNKEPSPALTDAAAPTPASLPVAPSLFQGFWDAYPHKRVNFAQAEAVWKSMDLDHQSDLIMLGLDRWKKSMDWSQNDGQWIPSPDKFLEKRRWLDDPPPYKPSLIRDRHGRAVTHDHGNVQRDYGDNGTF